MLKDNIGMLYSTEKICMEISTTGIIILLFLLWHWQWKMTFSVVLILGLVSLFMSARKVVEYEKILGLR